MSKAQKISAIFQKYPLKLIRIRKPDKKQFFRTYFFLIFTLNNGKIWNILRGGSNWGSAAGSIFATSEARKNFETIIFLKFSMRLRRSSVLFRNLAHLYAG